MHPASERQLAQLGRQVASAVRWNALLPVKVVASSLASLAVINILSPQDLGLVALVTSLAGLIGAWIDLGVERSLPKFYPEVERDDGRAGLLRFMREIALFKLASVALLIGGMLLAQEWFFAFWASKATDPQNQVQLFEHRWWLFGALVALLTFGAVYDVLMQVLIAFLRQKSFNLINLVTTLAQPLLLIAAVVLNLGIPGLVGALVAIPALAIVIAWNSVRRALATAMSAVGPGQRVGFYQRLARYSLMSYGLQMAAMLHSFQFGILFVADLAAASTFRVGYFIPAQALQIILAPINGLQVPIFARLREAGDMARTRETYTLMSRFMLIVVCPAAAGLAALAPNLTHIIDPRYGDAAVVAAIMAVTLFGASTISIARNILLVHEMYRPILLSRSLSLLTVPLLLWLPGWLGPLGIALAISGTNIAAELVNWIWARRALGLPYPWSFAGHVLLATVVMLIVVWPLANLALPVPPTLTVAERLGPALASQALIVAVGALVYLGAFRQLGGLSASDKDALATLRLPGTRHLLRLL